MRLKQGEHSILASFPSGISACAAVRALREAGIEEVQLDRVGSLTGLTLSNAGEDLSADEDARVLQAVDPAVSGLGVVRYGTASGEGFMVTVVTGGTQLNQALKIIARHGGKV